MRITATAAAASAVLGGALVLGLTAVPAAQAAPVDSADCATDAFGIAGKYGEFVLGDDAHSPDAEGAVAVGGNADFRGGFSVANELSAAEVDALPGRASLVVRGDLVNNGSATVVMKGNAVVGGEVRDRAVELHSGTFGRNARLIDFDAEFAKLRAYSTALAEEPVTAGAAATLNGTKLTLEGSDTTRNVFKVTTGQLERAKDIYLKVPAGATAIVNVSGENYDMADAGTTGFFLSGGQDYVLDDKLQSASDGKVRARLLWNFPEARTVTKNSRAAWPGSVLAPEAHLELGTGAPVNGSVWVASLHGSGGAGTHHFPFTGCLPEPGKTPSATPTPSGTPGTTPPVDSTPSASVTPPSESGTPSGDASQAVAPPTSSPSKSATPGTGGGDLASTGSSGTVPLVIGSAAVLAAGAGLVVAARRRAKRA
ncbi:MULTISPECIES: choice-of-anchor A family protein [unclassified Streptomyces]|uniref:choice-of-anchor A family protein n=1 Tax=unclassified Streptomyces TaxID=2593676 RepID=UPI00224FE2C9|nr:MULTISPECIES: choice-of-anchor A family protein [unclassified Streptomyces]MCX4790208.1 choice-of-anchor A family protein [Streptomyces sp. NBC_01221]MCX4794063.1 choice-of-anchor A family protein [Streptomyces sp. NBC_01242]WSP61901.1 choice-of-anchor A family protein [Streptomyces sp. NBC_01240]WSU20978.1 choice-of-anchor A family protein [Streptomyces sp. NBC_01108]